MGKAELDNYEYSLKVFRDNRAVYDYAIDTAFDEGKLKGKFEERYEMATLMKAEGEAIEKIMKYTGLTKEEIEKL